MKNIPSEHGISSGQFDDKTGNVNYDPKGARLSVILQYLMMWSKSLPMFGRMPNGSTELASTAFGRLNASAGVVLFRRTILFLRSSSCTCNAEFLDRFFGVACPPRLVISRFLFTHSRAFFRTTVSLAGSKLSRNSSFVNVVVGTSIEKVGCIC